MRILCYGDSNTWGYNAAGNLGKEEGQDRFPKNIRWTGILKELLDSDDTVIEEGLCGRTTVLDDPENPGCKGIDCVRRVFESHCPVDFIILMLGTNDLKEMYHQTEEDVMLGLKKVIDLFLEISEEKCLPKLKMLLISPIQILPAADGTYLYGFTKKSEIKRKELASLYQKLAQKYNFLFLDASKTASPCMEDGVHLGEDGHKKLGKAIADMIETQSGLRRR